MVQLSLVDKMQWATFNARGKHHKRRWCDRILPPIAPSAGVCVA